MSKTASEVFAAALALSEEDRRELAEMLVGSLDGDVDPTSEQAWTAEIERRLRKIESRQAHSISMDEAVARLRQAAQRQ